MQKSAPLFPLLFNTLRTRMLLMCNRVGIKNLTGGNNIN